MNVLVFGHSGQVASALRMAADKFSNMNVVSMGRTHADITRLVDVKQAIEKVKPDIIVNAAAYTAVDLAEDEPERAFALNEKALVHIGTVASEYDIPVIHLSTDYVFSGQGEVPYEVDDKVEPLGVYGQSKYAGEVALRSNCVKYVIVRTAWVYSSIGTNFVKTMLHLMGANKSIRVLNDQFGCPTSAHDIAVAILKLAPRVCETEFDEYGTYHLVSNANISWYDFAQEIQLQANLEYGADWSGRSCQILAIPTSEYPTKSRRPAYSVLSTHKFKEIFGFELPEWQASLAQCVKQLKEGNVT